MNATTTNSKKNTKKRKKKKRKASSLVRSAGTDKKLRSRLKTTEERQETARLEAERASVLLTEQAGFLEAEDGYETQRFKQRDIKKAVDDQSSKNVFDLKLEKDGPYRVNYTRNGRYMLLCGERGHTAILDCHTFRMSGELQLRETCRDACFLMNENMFAVAQKKYVYIYDKTGMELHCLRNHMNPQRLDYLPYHYLLVSVGETGYLKYLDVSIGKLCAELRTRKGSCSVMRQNPQNAIMNLGHSNGVVTMWSPNMSTPLVQMFCHHGPVRALAVDKSGKYMVSTGSDGQMKIWDLRTYKLMDSYFTTTPASSLDVSQRDLLAVGYGPHVQVWKDVFSGQKQKKPYMRHQLPGSHISNIRFRPFEDVMGIGHRTGISSMIVPGSGEPNYDAFDANPYEVTAQRRETEVKKLLDKLSPDMITLDSTMLPGAIDRAPAEIIARERRVAMEARGEKQRPKKEKNKMRGKNKIGKKIKKHQRNIWDANRKKLEQEKKRLKAERIRQKKMDAQNLSEASALSRFMKK